MLSKIVSDDTAQVISLSWSLSQCETDFTVIPSVNTLLAQAASQGQSVLAASGDSGSEGCAEGMDIYEHGSGFDALHDLPGL